MVRAYIKYKNGTSSLVHARSFTELFEFLKGKDIISINASNISTTDLRQGKK